MSTLFVNNLNTASGTTITVPTGKKLIGTDNSSIVAPGMVVQVVNATTGTAVSLSSVSGAVESNLAATITPKFSTSKILVLANQNTQTNGASYSQICLRRGTIASNTLLQIMSTPEGYNNSGNHEVNTTPTCYLDSPSTTSAVRYFCSIELLNGSSITAQTATSGTSVSTITLMEIAQ